MTNLEWGSLMAKKTSNRPAVGNCKDYTVDLSAYFDGELEGKAKDALEAHLNGCEGCRARLDNMSRLRVALSGLSRPGIKRTGSVMDMLKEKLAAEGAGGPKKPLVS